MEQFRGKYLVKDRATGKIYETPQFAYMLIAMFLFMKYPKATRLKYVKGYYHAISVSHFVLIPLRFPANEKLWQGLPPMQRSIFPLKI